MNEFGCLDLITMGVFQLLRQSDTIHLCQFHLVADVKPSTFSTPIPSSISLNHIISLKLSCYPGVFQDLLFKPFLFRRFELSLQRVLLLDTKSI
jgi:hypothetical protein